MKYKLIIQINNLFKSRKYENFGKTFLKEKDNKKLFCKVSRWWHWWRLRGEWYVWDFADALFTETLSLSQEMNDSSIDNLSNGKAR